MIVVAIIGILASVAVPQYQNYIAKTQVSRVMAETGALRTAIETCLMDGVDEGDCELGWTLSNIIGDGVDVGDQEGLAVTYNLSDGSAEIEASFGGNASSAIREETLTWARAGNDDDNAGAWTCSTSVASKFAPAGCTTSDD